MDSAFDTRVRELIQDHQVDELGIRWANIDLAAEEGRCGLVPLRNVAEMC
jgi:hypothetical protein